MNLFVGKERKEKTKEALKQHDDANKKLLAAIEEHLDPRQEDVCLTPQTRVTCKTPRLLKAVK